MVDREGSITAKLDNPNHGYDNTMLSFERTLEQLEKNYVDLFLIHWPNHLRYRSTISAMIPMVA